jgi:hydrogenase maturation protein HypF
MDPPSIERRLLTLGGVVQGVGFRPFVYAAARRRGLSGLVRNGPAGVTIEVEGSPEALDEFRREVTSSPPPGAVVDRCAESAIPTRGEGEFRILESGVEGGRSALISPDLAVCPECLREMRDPADRRHRYPFINCTHCGPRFTIIIDIPYDRERTSMRRFELCPACREEYRDPADRRFHAEPIACPACGPRLEFEVLAGPPSPRAGGGPIGEALAVLRGGGIVGVKGIGGFQLACDARSEGAVSELRLRKRRPAKPLAVMVADLEGAHRLVEVSPAAAALLLGPAAPIVLLPAVPGGGLAPGVAPDTDQVGVMLPAAPLHHLLLEGFGGPLVMTSGNASEEPIATTDQEGRERLKEIADGLLLHDREIVARYDDSVVRLLDGAEVVLRRARGLAPRPIDLARAAPREVLAVGGHLKSAFCLATGARAFLSQHLGDLDNPLTLAGFESTLAHYLRLFDGRPEVVAHDLHPDYLSTRIAGEKFPPGARLAVQHHHAHLAACLAEHGRDGPAIGVVLDGAGYGPDGTVWGGEVLIGDAGGYARAAALATVAMPGGEAAAREPWRMAAAHLRAAFGEDFPSLGLEFTRRLDRPVWRVLDRAIARGLNSPLTSSAGRLFDAVASLIGGRDVNLYEGHAAVGLEALARRGPSTDRPYPLPLVTGDPMRLDTSALIRAVVEDLRAGAPREAIAARFHAGLAAGLAVTCQVLRERTGIELAALTGGVFQNQILLESLSRLLRERGFEVLSHRRVPPNDGGLAFGQAAVAAEMLLRR